MSLLFAVAIAAVPFWIANVDGGAAQRFESARDDARTFLVRNPQLQVDGLGELMLDPTWLAEMREAAEKAGSGATVQLPPRILARSQARLDGLIASAYEERIQGDPAWRYGVLDARSPSQNYFVHAFVHESMVGMILGVCVLLLVGAALELTWGSLIFATFATAAIPVTAYAYRLLDGSSGLPWSGSAGLAGALLGAYFIRGLGGHFVVPGWLLLPTWLGVEAFVIRGFWIDDLGSVPWATFCAAVGIGALVSGALRLANLGSNLEAQTAKRAAKGPNPVVARAARLRSDGDPHQAFDLIQTAWRENPTSEEIAEAFFSIAVEVGQPEAAAHAIVPILRRALRTGDVSRAVEYWLPLATRECEVGLEATVAVRLGEALLDASHPEEAIFTLRSALEVGVSAAQATRIVNVARDLDDRLARQAARIALADASLDLKIRAELEPLVADTSDAPEVPETAPTPAPIGHSPLDRHVEAERHAVETTHHPIAADADLEEFPIGASDQNEASLQAQALDAGAFSAENLAVEPEPGAGGSSGDVLSHWDERESLATSDPEDLGIDLAEDGDEPFFDSTSIEDQTDLFGGALDLDSPDLLGGDSDTDLTPLIDATDELTSPLVAPGDEIDESVPQDERATAIFGRSDTPERSDAARPTRGTALGRIALERVSGSVESPGVSVRPMKAIDAVPVAIHDEGIEIDASPRGKSTIPYARIQSIAMAAVQGLGARPVLVVDVVLNGSDSTDEPMKLIRFRSDRFDPLSFERNAANPLAALVAWVGRLQANANAICLPSKAILEGRFSRFDSLEDYERRVLTASRTDGA